MRLNELRDNPGARRPRKRVGRGIASGSGKTSGKGQKGQKSRSGVSLLGYEGGQMPLHRRLPKRGFKKPFRKTYRVVNLGRLQAAIDAGRIDPAAPITEDVLVSAGLFKSRADGIRILAKGAIKAGVVLEVSGASKAARAAIAQAGGTIAPVAASVRKAGKGGAKADAARASSATPGDDGGEAPSGE